MTAQEAKEIAKKNVPFLKDILKEIKALSEDGQTIYKTKTYNAKTIEALKELGYDVEEHLSYETRYLDERNIAELKRLGGHNVEHSYMAKYTYIEINWG